MPVTVLAGDSRELLKTLADDSIDSVVCDPPYALVSIVKRFGSKNAAPAKVKKTGAYARASRGFMGKTWDTGQTAFDPEFWVEVWRVLKPGGHLLAFGGTRTYHWLACAIDDAGFEVRDMILWAYGSGFPKSHNVGKGIATDEAAEWDGWGTALKPSIEPVCMARKPLSEKSVAANVLRWGTGAINIDACRIAGSDNVTYDRHPGDRRRDQWRTGTAVPGSGRPTDVGRWPANLVHDGSDEVVDGFPETGSGQFPASRGAGGIGQDGHRGQARLDERSNDTGSAARFFYSAKADAADRHGSNHPTVKPVDLMAYLCRLVTPPGGTVLDCFAGSGTTGVAAMREGFDCILMEREDEYVADIHRRLAWARGEGNLTAQERKRPSPVAPPPMPLFGDST
jgi:site-specific DNA-methyltransferase (adenine-specific)